MDADQQQLLQSAAVLQQQLQNVMQQKEALSIQVLEIKKALDELESNKEKDVYKIAGPILIRSTKAKVSKDLKDRDESLDVRVKSMEKEEKRIKLRIEDLREKLSKASGGTGGG